MSSEKDQIQVNYKTDSRARTGWAVSVVLILIFSLLAAVNLYRGMNRKAVTEKSEAAVPVRVAEAALKTVKRQIERTADIAAARTVNVLSKVPGKVIRRVVVDEGQFVRKADLIASLEQDMIRARLDEVRAGQASARAALAQAEARLKVLAEDRRRIKALLADRAVSRQKYDHIEAEYQAAAAAADLARARISKAAAVYRRLKVLARNHDIVAPIDGLVIKRHLDPGNLTVPGRPIVTLADISTVKVVASLAEKDLAEIRPGTPVTVQVDALDGRRFKGRVNMVGTTVDPATRTARVEIRLPNPDGSLKPGMFAHAIIHLPPRKALVVPSQALERVPGTGQPFVYTVQDGRAVMHNVTAGEIGANWVEIVTGIRTGDLVVAEGQQRLRDGMPVKVIGRQSRPETSREAQK